MTEEQQVADLLQSLPLWVRWAGAIGLLVTVLTLFAKLVQWKTLLDVDRKRLQSEVHKVRKDWESARETDLKTSVDFMKEIRDDIRCILKSLAPQVATRGGPIRLDTFGESIASSIEASELAKELSAEQVKSLRGKMDYEVDAFCRKFVSDSLPKSWKRKVDQCAYERGIDVDAVLTVLHIVLRDTLIEEH